MYIDELYKNKGFLKEKSKIKIYIDKNGYAKVFIKINEGDLYFLKDVNIEGFKFNKELDLPIGDILNYKTINKTSSTIEKALDKNGYTHSLVYLKGIKTIKTKKPFLKIFAPSEEKKLKKSPFAIVGIFFEDLSNFFSHPISFLKAAIGEGGLGILDYKVYTFPLYKKQKVIFEGDTGYSKEKLLKISGLDKKLIDIFTIEDALNKLKRFYNDQGYLDTNITYKVKNNFNEVIFSIDKKTRYKVAKINTNSNYIKSVLKKMLNEYYQGVLVKKVLKNYMKDLENQGYVKPKYSVNIEKQENGLLNLDINVEKGIKVLITNIEFKGNYPKSLEKALGKYKELNNINYNAKLLEDIQKSIISYAKEEGYFDVRLDQKAKAKQINKSTYGYSYTYDIDFGKRYEIGEDIINGFNHLSEKSVHYMIETSKYYSYNKDVLYTLKNLRESDAFDDINLQTFLDKKDKKVYRLIDLEEAKRGFFSLSAGYNTEQRYIISSSFIWRDLFRTPTNFESSLNISGLVETYKIGLYNNYLFSPNLFTSIYAFRNFEEHGSFYLISRGFTPTIGYRLGRFWSFGISYTDSTNIVYNTLPSLEGTFNDKNLSFSLIRNYKNSETNPTKIGYDQITFTKNLNDKYSKYELYTFYLINILDNINYSFKVNFGADTQNPPIYHKFFLGGLKDMLGYSYESIGAPAGGKYMAFTRQEIDFPIRKPLNMGIILDIGNVSNNLYNLSKNLKEDIGISLFVNTPIGPAKFIVAKPITKIPSASSSLRFYITIGYYY